MNPTLAIVFGFGSATALEIAGSAHGLCDLVFVCDPASPYTAESLPLLESLGRVVPTTGRVAVVEQLRKLDVSGILTFADSGLATAAQLAESLRLSFHSAETAMLLADKHRQRRRLASHKVPSARFAVVGSPADAAPALATVGVPAVLKPRSGAGSRNTVLVSSAGELDAAVTAAFAAGDRDLVLEEYLIGDSTIAGPAWGDYVSVESLVLDGRVAHLGVTGKPPLAEPFRETGAFFPSTLSDSVQRQACGVTTRALHALGVTSGVAHTELKLTAAGPHVIEVNGRLGGYVNDVFTRSTGISPLRMALCAALRTVGDVPQPAPATVAYQFRLAPPVWATTVSGISGVPETMALAGVRRVELLCRPGDEVDWRHGTVSAVAVVHGEAPDHAALEYAKVRIEETLVIRYAR
ncbi:ATP-grasp domain-containing protein [Micromonospora sp. CPCC 206060]|uniref:ATP-grasp domain-containing protein n=1 Tax=Micromonospora sp. CPCC 206060 TaxID=3122406 RepID=UPI002FF0823C